MRRTAPPGAVKFCVAVPQEERLRETKMKLFVRGPQILN
jgi:hypothetical protein